MQYAITSDKKIHQVTDEKEFYKYNPKAQDITALPNVYNKFIEQEKKEKVKERAEKQFKELIYQLSDLGYDKGDIDILYESALRNWRPKEDKSSQNFLWRLIVCSCGEVIENRASNFEDHTYEGEMLDLKKCRQIDMDMASEVKQGACEGCQEAILVGGDN